MQSLAKEEVKTSMLILVVMGTEMVINVAFYDIRERQIYSDVLFPIFVITKNIGNVYSATVHERIVTSTQLTGPSRGGAPSNRSARK